MLVFGLSVSYALLLLRIARGWYRLKKVKCCDTNQRSSVSIIVAVRNEAASLPALLKSLQAQHYPADRYEVILVDDHSTDASELAVRPYLSAHMRWYSLPPGQYAKKAALAFGIAQSSGSYLLTTDADCVLPANWISQLTAVLDKPADMVLAPVRIRGDERFLTAFQGLDVAGTMLLTGAAVQEHYPVLANGANLGFRRSLLDRLGGYAPHAARSSGDDIFLLHAAVQCGAQVNFCP
ncbi:MAG: glycosyltransferase, partial [Bacteroidetes bacterium]